MQKLLKKIDSVHHLTRFEVAARLGSFSKAAWELNVSQPAISQSIRRLERAIGVALFHRDHRSVRLTRAGELLYHDVATGFQRIEETVTQLSRVGRGRHVTLSVSTAFATYWMVPRLKHLHDRHPQIDLRLQATDKDLDLEREGVSLAIWRGHSQGAGQGARQGTGQGTGQWRGYGSSQLAPEILRPVAAPDLFDGMTSLSADALTTQRLIHLEEPFRKRPGWVDWFRAMGVSYRDRGDGLRLTDYALVLQAAMAGEGVALGWHHLASRLITQGVLAPVTDHEWVTGQSFHIVWSEAVALSAEAQIVRSWLMKQAQLPERPANPFAQTGFPN